MYINYPIDELEAIRAALVNTQKTLAIAESVTAGLLQGAFSQATDARLFFQGGITAYNVAQKCRQLDIEPIHAQDCEGVSIGIADELARNIANRFCSHIGIGVTGYAAPVPEKHIDRPHAYYAIYDDGKLLESCKIEGYHASALEIQLHFVTQIVRALYRLVVQTPPHMQRIQPEATL